jgi:hypothetical protein
MSEGNGNLLFPFPLSPIVSCQIVLFGLALRKIHDHNL